MSGQGQVKCPELDGRLRANRAKEDRLTALQCVDRQPLGQGRVKYPETDGRLRKNREKP